MLRELPPRQTAAEAGLGLTTVKDVLRGAVEDPRLETSVRLTDVAVAHARARLSRDGREVPRDDQACLAAYLDERRRHDIPWEDVLAILRERHPPIDIPERTYRHLLQTGAPPKSRARELMIRRAALRALTKQADTDRER